MALGAKLTLGIGKCSNFWCCTCGHTNHLLSISVTKLVIGTRTIPQARYNALNE